MEIVYSLPDCPCGREHKSPTEKVIICENALKYIRDLTTGFDSIMLVSDGNTYNICGKTVCRMLDKKISADLVLCSDGSIVIPDEKTVSGVENAVPDGAQLIIGVGSGVINDICKYVSFKKGLPYYIVATAPSMDGYASSGAAFILGGMKITLNAKPPKAIIADLDIIKDAPYDMIAAGYGDIIGKFSCLNDWELSAFVNGEYFCDRVYGMVYSTAERIRELGGAIADRDKNAVGELMKALVIVGIAMAFVGNSRPASGSEHHLSHFFEITGIIDKKPYLPHGIDVMCSSYETALIREKIINSVPHRPHFDGNKWRRDINAVYKTAADGVVRLQESLGWYKNDHYDRIYENLETVKQILIKAPSPDETKAMCDKVGAYLEKFRNMYGKDKIATAVKYAKDLKDRYSVLWLYDMYFA